ncbi:hypothetical protein [Streptomyces sp. NBC_01481]|uniref:hypothetical protein n=1 Tax=Streptomyces sp. NBC_01481 TaxID=2975869 RepID=UPI00224D4D28|nr:hypothetical protein [Streptomyces sp. NBC_01481]MCX4585202.1 hypothetical protein [Streptomyces sp. NBC_01481]
MGPLYVNADPRDGEFPGARGNEGEHAEAAQQVLDHKQNCPGVSLGFTRQTSQEVPRTPDGLPVHVTPVLVVGEHYYSRIKNRAR